MAAPTVRIPARPARDTMSTRAMITSPDPNEISAATNPSPRSLPSCPLMRDCSATLAPHRVTNTRQSANLVREAVGRGVGLVVMVFGIKRIPARAYSAFRARLVAR